MPKRKPKYFEKPHIMRPEIRARFEALMRPAKERLTILKPRWQLWRWDTLEDVQEYNI